MKDKKVIIIGSGIGGLAAAMRLSTCGINVQIFEKQSYPGGKIRTKNSVAGLIDSGPTVLTMHEIFEELFKEGIKCEVDLRNQKINYKIREHSLAKVPLLLICGKKEISDKSITLRRLGSEKQETIKFAKVIKDLKISNNLPIK